MPAGEAGWLSREEQKLTPSALPSCSHAALIRVRGSRVMPASEAGWLSKETEQLSHASKRGWMALRRRAEVDASYSCSHAALNVV
jgi:hypothetical protein